MNFAPRRRLREPRLVRVPRTVPTNSVSSRGPRGCEPAHKVDSVAISETSTATRSLIRPLGGICEAMNESKQITRSTASANVRFNEANVLLVGAKATGNNNMCCRLKANITAAETGDAEELEY
jgi:hypothetical protein